MKILADKNIPFVEEAFSAIGRTNTAPGRNIDPEAVKDADVLLVRTVTDVNEKLLAGSAVKFVGTATIGFDHIDKNYLERENIGFSYAPGSNANSVAEYIVSALFNLSERFNITLAGRTAGIIGCGNVGSRVDEKLKLLGIRTILNDPPLSDKTSDKKYSPVGRILKEADIITVHTPLTDSGRHPTRHLCDDDFFMKTKKTPIFINSSRGAVCDSRALLNALGKNKISHAILDVWENEPDISLELLEKCSIGTPHIAGYSLDGKANATGMLFQAVCKHFNLDKTWKPAGMPLPENPVIEVLEPDACEKTVGLAVKTAYNIIEDDLRLRKIAGLAGEEKKRYFDALRNEYPVRREFKSFTVKSPDSSCLKKLQQLGFVT